MRCYCCNKMLSDFESTRKSMKTNEYLDMCNKCYASVEDDIKAYERYDLYDEHEDGDEGVYEEDTQIKMSHTLDENG